MAQAERVAVAGIGATDYRADAEELRAAPAHHDRYALGAEAYRAALRDAGIEPGAVDGLIVGPTTDYERMGEVLGISPRWAGQDNAGNAVIQAAMAIEAGAAECVALVYGTDQRSRGLRYGGVGAVGTDGRLVYRYYAPWGLTSQGALYALVAQRYMARSNMKPEQLARVAIGQREHARMNARAVKQSPLSVDEYLASPFIAEPLRRHDYCLVNDGGVSLIVTSVDHARALGRHPVVALAGYGRADDNHQATSMRPRLLDFYGAVQRDAAAQLWRRAGTGADEIDAFQVYDSFSIHVPIALEGFGYCAPGETGEYLAAGRTAPGGALPVNTSGGMLSESYMMGWNHQFESVVQLRHDAGDRQVANCRQVHYVSNSQGKVSALVYRRL